MAFHRLMAILSADFPRRFDIFVEVICKCHRRIECGRGMPLSCDLWPVHFCQLLRFGDAYDLGFSFKAHASFFCLASAALVSTSYPYQLKQESFSP